MTREAKYTCDHCKEPIDLNSSSYSVEYHGIEGRVIMGNNLWPTHGFHYHLDCFSELTHIIVEFNGTPTKGH